MAAEKFTFPDEQGQDGPQKKAVVDEIEIKIEDDTPPEDRGREPMPKELVNELDNEDLKEYSEKVQQRMKQMKKVWHDERRAKEAVTREKDEAIKFAEAKIKENQELRKRMGDGEKIFITEVTAAAKTQIEAARHALKLAYESGDSDKIVAAQDALTDAKLKQREVEGYRPTLQVDKDGVEKAPQTQATPPAPTVSDPKSDQWKAKNGWFGVEPDMTALALGVHEKLVKNGVDPRSDEYYRQIDSTMKKRFPEYFEGNGESREEPPTRSRAATVVAPATRSTAPRQVHLTPTQVSLAKRLGITPEAYAREMIKQQESQNG